MKNICSELSVVAEKVASYLDSYDAGDLFLSSIEVDEKPSLLCQYKRDDFILNFDVAYSGEFEFEPKGECRFTFRSISEALSFISMVESKRQKNRYPTIVLGKMPGTVL